MQAAVDSVRPAAAPDVIQAASTSSRSATYCPDFSSSSFRSTKCREAATMASRTCGLIRDPPSRVTVPSALMTFLRPSLS